MSELLLQAANPQSFKDTLVDLARLDVRPLALTSKYPFVSWHTQVSIDSVPIIALVSLTAALGTLRISVKREQLLRLRSARLNNEAMSLVANRDPAVFVFLSDAQELEDAIFNIACRPEIHSWTHDDERVFLDGPPIPILYALVLFELAIDGMSYHPGATGNQQLRLAIFVESNTDMSAEAAVAFQLEVYAYTRPTPCRTNVFIRVQRDHLSCGCWMGGFGYRTVSEGKQSTSAFEHGAYWDP